jgi:two-component system, OmpR family, sensor histidine kinase CpxA
MPRRFPLFAKILCWFLLNIALLAFVGWLILQQQTRFGFDSLLAGRSGDRIRSVGALVEEELREKRPAEWAAVLRKFESAYPLYFHVFLRDGREIAGGPVTLPADVLARLARIPPGPPPPAGAPPQTRENPPDGRFGRRPARPLGGPPDGPPNDGPPNQRRPPPDELDGPDDGPPPVDGRPGPPGEDIASFGDGMPPAHPIARTPEIVGFIRAGDPKRYWVLLRAQIDPRMPGGPPILVLVSGTLSAGGLILDYAPFLWAGVAALLLSALFWLPLIRSITRSIAAMRDATVNIADGRFDVRVDARRRDELGALGSAINGMSERLAGLMHGQRRFLSDVAHELCAPLSRLQMALGILEGRAAEADRERLLDLREEVDHMAGLVNELLSFSRAALGAQKIQLRPIEVRQLMEKVARRETVEGAKIEIVSEEPLSVQGDPDLLQRALGNLLRNAIRYAAGAGPITIVAETDGREVQIAVADCGPGVPEESLPQLFDPFFRVDSSRTRETGGVGLGLTIARTCVEACGGTIAVRNRRAAGLCVSIRLPQAAVPALDC